MTCKHCGVAQAKPPFISKGEVMELDGTFYGPGLPNLRRTGMFRWTVAVYRADNSCTLHGFDSGNEAEDFAARRQG